MKLLSPGWLLVVAALALSCNTKQSKSGPAADQASGQPSALASAAAIGTGAAAAAKFIPIPPSEIAKVVNPEALAPYDGPTGSVAGVVRMTGDPVPEDRERVKKIPVGKCLAVRGVYAPLVREGRQREVADALVAVTGYQGFLPETQENETVVQKDCAYDRRTIAMTFGQRLDVLNKGPEPGMPQLVGVPGNTLLVAVPGGQPIMLTTPKPGRYMLLDHSHPYSTADVFVLAYPTTAVTDIDGRFDVSGIPVGEAKLSLMVPATGQTLSRDIIIEADKTLNLELELAFDAKQHVRADGSP